MGQKILCVTNDFGPRAGGIETFVMGLIERLPRGHVIVYTSAQGDTSDYDAKWLRDFGVEVIRDRSKILLPTPRVSRTLGTLVRSRAIKTAFFGAAAPLGLMAHYLRKSGLKQIVALTHGHEVWWAKIWPFSLAMKRIGSTIDHITYLGEFTRGEISRSISSPARDAMVRIAPGIDTDHFKPREDSSNLRRELGLSDKKVIVSVGRLVHRKGQDQLIEAMPIILGRIPDAHLIVIGQGPYRKFLEKRVRDLSLEDSVTFIGRIQHDVLPTYIGVGDVFAMPSRSRLAGLEVEGLGIVYLEASACGLAVIAGRSGGAPDAILESITGVSVDGTNSREIADAAIALLSDLARAREMGQAGRAWIIEQWSWDLWSSEFRRILKVDQPI